MSPSRGGRYLVMRYGPRAGWRGKYATCATRHHSLAYALDAAAHVRRRFEARVFIAMAGAPATVPRAKRGQS